MLLTPLLSTCRLNKECIMKKILLIMLAAAALIFIQSDYEFNAKSRYEFNIHNRLISAITVWGSIDLDYSDLHSHLNEATINSRYYNIDLDCGRDSSPLGERSCYTHIRYANGINAWYIVFFFTKDKLQRVKVDIPPGAHADTSQVVP